MPADFEPNKKQKMDWPTTKDVPPIGPDADDDALWELLSVYADGEATPEEAARVEAMLRADPAWARRLDFVRLTADSVHSLPEVEPPAALRESIFVATSRRRSLANRLAAAWGDFRRSLAPD